jgi:biopolymer transport protein ExbB
LIGVAAPVAADEPRTLDELLQQVREARTEAAAVHRERERRFIEARNQQRQLLEQARRDYEREEERQDTLQIRFDENESEIADLEETLQARMGHLGELHGVVRQVSGDLQGVIRNSIVSAQFPGRSEQVARLAETRALPSIDQLETLWFMLQEEMTESGKVVRYPTTIVRADGTREETDVVRVGVHNTVVGDRFLRYVPETGALAELGRQPAGRYRSMARDLYRAETGTTQAMAVDPSRGTLLGLLVQRDTFMERIRHGALVGVVIIALGFLGLLLVIERAIYLYMAGQKIGAQVGSGKPDPGNALGRIMGTYAENKDDDVETLELKIDEAILKETPALEARLGAIKIISAVAPLLGLLGTVTGMIETFQMITLFGTGDPQLMAGGISQALVTTMMGLTVAIPLVLMHAAVAARSKRLIQTLEEQSTGIIASHAEKKK